jgi:halogenation protein CepH
VDSSIVIVGGGPAGAAAGRLLASWGHRIVLLTGSRPGARVRGLAESLPPSSRKILAQVGVLAAVERAGFYQSSGNTVWWGSHEPRVERFASNASGLQVDRSAFDALLLDAAADAGVDVRRDAHVRSVDVENGEPRIEYERRGSIESISCAWVLDCSGRAGMLARRFRIPGTRMYSLVGEWRGSGAWNVPDPTHTVVEAFESGWAWSIPLSAEVRHAGVMLAGPSPRADGVALADAYRAEMSRVPALSRTLAGASLSDAWACDASTYSSLTYAGTYCGRGFLLVGDAGAFIDPLSSCGVRKALASGWVAAIVVNTCLADSARKTIALEFFSDREREVCATHARRSRDFAVEALEHFPSRFWSERASREVDEVTELADPAAVADALRALRAADEIDLEIDGGSALANQPVIRGREIVLEEALALEAAHSSPAGPRGVRYINNVDLVALARLACHHRRVPDVFEAYCASVSPVPLPDLLGALSLLVAARILRQRDAIPC